jgi:hypothetical protein
MPNKPILDQFFDTLKKKYQEFSQSKSSTNPTRVTTPKSTVSIGDMLKSKSVLGSSLTNKINEQFKKKVQ